MEVKLHRFALRDSLLYYDDRLCIPCEPPKLRANILHDLHDSPIGGHCGQIKLYHAV